ncbi:hypothetical protein ACFL6Y_05490 [Elusimicrobiota bacterium]
MKLKFKSLLMLGLIAAIAHTAAAADSEICSDIARLRGFSDVGIFVKQECFNADDGGIEKAWARAREWEAAAEKNGYIATPFARYRELGKCIERYVACVEYSPGPDLKSRAQLDTSIRKFHDAAFKTTKAWRYIIEMVVSDRPGHIGTVGSELYKVVDTCNASMSNTTAIFKQPPEPIPLKFISNFTTPLTEMCKHGDIVMNHEMASAAEKKKVENEVKGQKSIIKSYSSRSSE